MYREICLSCRRPRDACLCPDLRPMQTRTRIVLLMHPKEYRRQRTGTGRLACLHLANSEIVPGLALDGNPRVRAILDDPETRAFLLYPSPDAANLSACSDEAADSGPAFDFGSYLGAGRLVVFLIDSTWACANSVLRSSPRLASLPRLRFEPREASRWLIKRQPRDFCLSTIEAIHELLLALEAAGLDEYPDKLRLLEAFASMQDYQIRRARAAGRPRFLAKDDG
jgi:DTW domain-containing protein